MRFIGLLTFLLGVLVGYLISQKWAEKGPLYVSERAVKELPTTNIHFASPQPVNIVYYTDTVVLPQEVIHVNTIDTAALISDYMAKRNYVFTNVDSVSADTIKFDVQYNRVSDFNWVHHANVITNTIIPKPSVKFWVMGGLDTKYDIEIGAGVSKGHWGFGLGAATDKSIKFKTIYTF
jgi:hypothetical protein